VKGMGRRLFNINVSLLNNSMSLLVFVLFVLFVLLVVVIVPCPAPFLGRLSVNDSDIFVSDFRCE
jgi:hypothetical protein